MQTGDSPLVLRRPVGRDNVHSRTRGDGFRAVGKEGQSVCLVEPSNKAPSYLSYGETAGRLRDRRVLRCVSLRHPRTATVLCWGQRLAEEFLPRRGERRRRRRLRVRGAFGRWTGHRRNEPARGARRGVRRRCRHRRRERLPLRPGPREQFPPLGPGGLRRWQPRPRREARIQVVHDLAPAVRRHAADEQQGILVRQPQDLVGRQQGARELLLALAHAPRAEKPLAREAPLALAARRLPDELADRLGGLGAVGARTSCGRGSCRGSSCCAPYAFSSWFSDWR